MLHTKLALSLLSLGSFLVASPYLGQRGEVRAGAELAVDEAIERGRYLVQGIGCSDCHTPWHIGPNGPEPNEALGLSGHPQDLRVAAIPTLPGEPWNVAVAATNTAWAGPWGVSFTANLTPDVETGIGSWTEETFLAAIRNGKHLGMGRDILPPMPFFAYRTLSDGDLKAMFAYLMSRPAISNRVPEPLAPGS